MGIHRYQFNLYDITNKSIDNVEKHISSTDLQIIKVTKEDMNKPDFRKAYNEKLLSFLKLQFKLLFTIQFKVTSKDMINKTKNAKFNNAKIKNTAQQSTTQQSINQSTQQQQQLQQQQKQIEYLQEQNKNRVGFGTFLAADLTGSAIFSLF